MIPSLSAQCSGQVAQLEGTLLIGINPSEAQIVTTVRRTKLGTMLPSGLDDGTTDASAYFRCVAILAVRRRPLKTHPKFLAGVASLGETLAPKKLRPNAKKSRAPGSRRFHD
jgi:hypothetical protein